jgi:hypothetical protein
LKHRPVYSILLLTPFIGKVLGKSCQKVIKNQMKKYIEDEHFCLSVLRCAMDQIGQEFGLNIRAILYLDKKNRLNIIDVSGEVLTDSLTGRGNEVL